MELIFKVQVSSVRAKQLNCPGRTSESFPLFRLNFDEKVVESELYQGAGDPEWQSKPSFEYRLREANLQEAIASLSQRRVSLEVCFVDMRGGRELRVGTCSVDLLSVCSGPNQFTFALQSDAGAPAGSVFFALSMEQQTSVQVEFKQVDISGLPAPAPYRLAYHFASVVGRDVESSIVPAPTSNPQWSAQMLPRLEIRSTLRSLLGSTVRVHVEDMQQRGARVVVFELPIRELLTTNATHSAPFKKNAYGTSVPGSAQANFAALATGTIQFANIPVFAQFERGENQQGNIHGKPLLPSCPTPPSFAKVPKRLPDLRPGQAQFELAQHQSMQPDLTNPNAVNSWGAQPAPPLAYHPAPPQQPPQHHSVSYAQHHQDQQRYGGYQDAQAYHQQSAPPPQQSRNQFYDATAAGAGAATNEYASYAADDRYGMQSSRRASPALPMAPAPPSIGYPRDPTAALAALRAKSPLANAGESLIRKHQDTVAAVEQQQRRVQALAQDLHERTVTETSMGERRSKEIDAEEQRVLNELRRVDRTIDDLRHMREEQEASTLNFQRKSEAERVGLVAELENLTALYLQVTELAKQISEHAQEDERVKERSRVELENARNRFDMDTRGLGEVESKIHYRLGQPAPPSFGPSSIVNGSTSNSSTAGSAYLARQGSPVRIHSRTEPRSISPPRSFGALHSAAPSLDVSREDRGSIRQHAGGAVVPAMHADVDALVEAVRLNDFYRLQQVVKRSPRAVFENNNLLHIACAQSAPDFDIVSMLVYHRPELINGVDTSSGSTPLHFACNASAISMPVVDLLLSKGASTSTIDDDGLSPFHVATRNLNDTTHNLKKLLLLKGNADINGLTGRGETPAHLVCTHDRYLDVLRFLVRYGANLNAVARVHNADNILVPVTPLQKSRWYGPAADECRRFLEQGGAVH